LIDFVFFLSFYCDKISKYKSFWVQSLFLSYSLFSWAVSV
jgi:hypothetical protein